MFSGVLSAVLEIELPLPTRRLLVSGELQSPGYTQSLALTVAALWEGRFKFISSQTCARSFKQGRSKSTEAETFRRDFVLPRHDANLSPVINRAARLRRK